VTLSFQLPYPVSANRYWRSFRGRQVVSAEARAYKAEAALRARLAGAVSPFAGGVRVELALHPRKPLRATGRPTRCIDVDNALKVLIDSLNGVAWVDDAQVVRLAIERAEPIPGGGVVVRVEEMS
jgi:crossover junction endodeoxyribonuclease RusA